MELVYCNINLQAPRARNVRIHFESLSFHGPDYSSDTSGDQRCLLAGVAIADGIRLLYQLNQDQYFDKDSTVPPDTIADNVFPEIAICHEVLFNDEGHIMFDLPLKTFTSFPYTSETNILLYQYFFIYMGGILTSPGLILDCRFHTHLMLVYVLLAVLRSRVMLLFQIGTEEERSG